MAVSRMRRTQSQREHDNLVDDYVTQGFGVIEQGAASTMLRKRSWGSVGGHVLWGLLTLWWTFGIGNVIYALIAHYTAEKVMVRIEQPDGRFAPSSAPIANGVSRPREMDLN